MNIEDSYRITHMIPATPGWTMYAEYEGSDYQKHPIVGWAVVHSPNGMEYWGVQAMAVMTNFEVEPVSTYVRDMMNEGLLTRWEVAGPEGASPKWWRNPITKPRAV